MFSPDLWQVTHPISLFSCHPLPSVPSFLLLLFVPLISAFLFFFFKLCERAITATSSFSAQAAKFILEVFRLFILGSLLGRHICGKTKRPGAGAFPLGIIEAGVKIGKSFFGKWNQELVSASRGSPSVKDGRKIIPRSFLSLFISSLPLFAAGEDGKTTIWVLQWNPPSVISQFFLSL